MKVWQKDALLVIREARFHATKTLDTRLHLACCRAIEAMVMEGGQVPSELRTYARKTRELHGREGAPNEPRSATEIVG